MATYDKPHFVEIDEGRDGQRVDNFLITYLKGVPKSHVYRILRKGEVRINKGRCKPDTRLRAGDSVRIPPIRLADVKTASPSDNLKKLLESRIVFEDKALLIVNKPSGLAVHGGSGVSLGLIEALRQMRPELKFLELVHRLDRDTSGLIMIAKKRSMLTWLHAALRGDGVDKRYLALVAGSWSKRKLRVDAPLEKNHLQSGERMVRVTQGGKRSLTEFRIVQPLSKATLVEAKPVTGRTHQIRVHTQYAGHPIGCDPKYGDAEFDKLAREKGLKRLFLHAWRLTVPFEDGTSKSFEAPLDDELQSVVDAFS